MFYSTQRSDLRNMFFETWHKYQTQLPLEPVEQQILQVILEHPEYHNVLSQPDKFVNKDYLPQTQETNPFLHMSLHLGIREQIATNRPAGITTLYQQLLLKYSSDYLETEHAMLQVLAQQMWDAQHNNKSLDTLDELQFMRRLGELYE